EDGGQLVERSGQTLREIVASVKKVSDIVAEMAAAAREQASGIEQVNKAILQMDQVTQQNAALVEETAAASHAMGDQAQELQNLMSFFTVDDRGGAANVARSPIESKARHEPRPSPGLSRRPPPVAVVKPIAAKARPAIQPAPVEKKYMAPAAASAEWREF
ncbi:MAG: methyl-accepting chemotaxis protein, partial [Candidatus Contendobacter sp.]|nr:methyl-accepting chemotaxis protein [Candidatus Contendobacter sp.]